MKKRKRKDGPQTCSEKKKEMHANEGGFSILLNCNLSVTYSEPKICSLVAWRCHCSLPWEPCFARLWSDGQTSGVLVGWVGRLRAHLKC